MLNVVKKGIKNEFIKKLLLVLFIVLKFEMVYGAEAEGNVLADKTYEVNTKNGITRGFFITTEGHFLTQAGIMEGIYSTKIKLYMRYNEDLLKLKTDRERGYTLLKMEKILSSEGVVELGDSDTVDIGDRLYIVNGAEVRYGEVLSRELEYNGYKHDNILTDFVGREADEGRPVYSAIENKVVGLYIKQGDNYIVVPINVIKPQIKEYLQSLRGYDAGEDPPSLFMDKEVIKDIGGQSDYNFVNIEESYFSNDGYIYFLDTVEKVVGVIYTDKLLSGALADVIYRIKLSEPKSLTVSKDGLLYLLEGDKLLILNRKLEIVKELSYELEGEDKALKVFTLVNRLYIKTASSKYYIIRYDKMQGAVNAVQVGNSLNIDNVKGFMDVTYETNKSYWLFNNGAKATLYVMGEEESIERKITLADRGLDLSSLSVYKGYIYILDRGKEEVRVYDNEGNFVKSWEVDTRGRYEGHAKDIRISSRGIVLISYNGLPYFRLYTIEGELVKEISSRGDDDFVSPVSLTIDEGGKNLLVGSQEGILYKVSIEKEAKKEAKKENTGEKAAISLEEEKGVIEGKGVSNSEVGKEDGGKDKQEKIKDVVLKIVLTDDREEEVSIRGLKYVDKQTVYITDTKNSKILLYRTRGSKFEIVKTHEDKILDDRRSPIQLSARGDKVYILDKGNSRILEIDKGANLKSFFELKNSKNKLVYAQDLTISEDGKRIYILGENKLLMYKAEGKLLKEINIEEGESSYMGYAKGLEYSGGLLYITDTYNNRILVYTEEFNLIGYFGKRGGILGEFMYPWDIVSSGDGKLYIADKGNHRVLVYRRKLIRK